MRPIGFLQSVNKRWNERLDFLLGHDHTENFGDLPIERPVIEPLELEMIHRINLVAEAFESTD